MSINCNTTILPSNFNYFLNKVGNLIIFNCFFKKINTFQGNGGVSIF